MCYGEAGVPALGKRVGVVGGGHSLELMKGNVTRVIGNALGE